MFYHVGDCQHTPNIQIHQVIGENDKCVFQFTEKNVQNFWPARQPDIRIPVSHTSEQHCYRQAPLEV